MVVIINLEKKFNKDTFVPINRNVLKSNTPIAVEYHKSLIMAFFILIKLQFLLNNIDRYGDMNN